MVLRDDPRLRDIIVKLKPGVSIPRAVKPRKSVAIIGFPFDEGCARNGGRPGAKEGPRVFRKQLYTYGCVTEQFEKNIAIIDTGDVDGRTLEDVHDALREKVSEALRMGWIPFCVGGSNDQSYPNGLGLLDYLKENQNDLTQVGVVNIDAHFDVRPLKGIPPKIHSGSPFKQLLESPKFKGKFVEYAAQRIQCSEAHTQYLESRGHEIVWYDDDIELMSMNKFREQFEELLTNLGSELFVSFDIDSVRYADCPGVSCPSPIGLTAEQALKICEISGRNPHTRLMDMSEFNPTFETNDVYKTGKLVAFMFWYFCQGVAKRQPGNSNL